MKSLDFFENFEFNGSKYQVRPVCSNDIETLRLWKNKHRFSFHYQEIIEPSQQAAWFEKFQKDSQQQILVLEKERELLACVGYRDHSNGKVELFNLIKNENLKDKTGLISAFFEVTKRQLQKKGYKEIILEVLKTNPTAIAWYMARGFQKYGEETTFSRLVYQL